MTTPHPTDTMTEADYVTRIIDTAHTLGWHVAHFRPARTSRGWRTPMQGDPGFPDLVLARNGRVLLVEIKTNRGRIRHQQRAWLDALGPHATVWRPRDWPDVLATLDGTTAHV